MDPILLGVILTAAGEAIKFGLDSITMLLEAKNSGWTDEEVRARYAKMVAARKAVKDDWAAAGEGPPPGTKAGTGID